MRPIRLLLLASLLVVGCAADQPDSSAADESASLADDTLDEALERESAQGGAQVCEAIEERASALLASNQHCSADSDCTLASIEAPCLGALLCPKPVSKSANLPLLRRRAKSLSATYKKRCDRCAVARCISPESTRVFCDQTTKRCASEMITTPPPPPPPPPPVDARFQCKQDSDCTVKDVGNCCGYYPRCANVNATFERPKCDGMAGVCGFPVIERCACVENTCRAMQGDSEV